MTRPQPLLALNWKMNKTPSEARAWAADLSSTLTLGGAELAVLAPAVDLPVLADTLPAGVALGGQDISRSEAGAFTGEISGAMLRDVGATYVIVGHSERRQYHAETDAVVAAKARQAQASGLIPIVCVGESLDVRDRGEQVDFTLDQLRGSTEGVGGNLIVAYEPVWAIGTGKTATAGDAEEMAAAIRGALAGLYTQGAQGFRILYGGSVNPGNVASICAQPNVNGALVGGASLKVADVVAMADALQ